MDLAKSSKIITVSLIAALFVFSTFAVITPVKGSAPQAAPSQPASATANSITFVDYGGSDASGVADLQAGKIDEYNFQLTPAASASLPSSGFNQYLSPGSIYGLYVNPQNTTAGTGNYNPFYFQKVRFALNYLIDRTYFSQTIEGGKFVPCISAVCAEPDSVTVAPALAAFSNVTFNFQFANQSIYNTLIGQKGISYTAGHYYVSTTIEGHLTTKAITVQLFDRIDDPVRHAFMQYLNSQLQKVGFNTQVTTGTLSDAFVSVFGSAPANATFDIYPASNSQIWALFDSNAVNFYSAGYYQDLPGSDHHGLDWVGANDSTTQEAYTTYLYDQADVTGAIPLLNSQYSNLAQRGQELANLTYYGVLGATYVTLGTSLAPQGADTAVSGVTANFLVDPIANYQNYLTMTVSASGATKTAGDLKIGVRHLQNGAGNPVGGDSDAYTGNDVVAPTSMPLWAYGPSSGYPYSTGLTFVVNGNHPTADIAVPTTAYWFNGATDTWANVASGSMAEDDVTVNVANIVQNTKYADGTPVTLADMLWQYVEMGLVVKSSGSLFDAHMSAVYGPAYSQIVGIQVINSTSVRLFTTNTYFPDPYIAGLTGSIADVLTPLGYSSSINGGGQMPWELYYAMNQVVSGGQAAWSTSSATKLKVDWLNLLNAKDVGNVQTALNAAGSTIPPEMAQLQTLSGQTWVTASTAMAGFTAASQFITTNGNAQISDGAFYISQFSPSTSPAFMTLSKNANFQAGSEANANLFAPAVVLTPHATIPPILSAGGSVNVQVLQTIDGSSSSSAASGASVIAQLVSGGKLVFSQTLTTDSSGNAKVTLPSNLVAGTYLLSIYSYSATSSLVQPIVQSVTLTAAQQTTSTSAPPQTTTTTSAPPVTTTTSAPPGTTTTTPTTTTSSTDYTPYIYGGIVVVIIVIVAVALARRRGGTP